MLRSTSRALLALTPMLAACGAGAPFHPSTPTDVAAGSPLGPSYVLVPLPNDDDTLLGRVMLSPLENGRSLDEVSRPNECADKLTAKKEGPLASTFEDAQELSAGGKARAALGAFGFEGDAQTATHFYYKLDVSKRVAQTDTSEYVTCCKEKGSCGYGFVSALIYGDGEYATAAETNAEGSVTIPVAGGAGDFVKAKVLHKRKVHGYVAALVTVTDPKSAQAITVLGDPAAAGIVLTEQNLPEQVKARFELQKIQVVASTDPSGPGEFGYVFKDGNGEITENEFARRYGALTGGLDLAQADQTRHPGLLVGGAITLAVGAAATVVGALDLRQSCTYAPSQESAKCTPFSSNYFVVGDGTQANPVGVGLLTVGVLADLGGAALLIVGAALGGGTPSDHVINKFDAALYVAKYNRALLRKTIQETETRMRELSGQNTPSLSVSPIITPTFLGMRGTF